MKKKFREGSIILLNRLGKESSIFSKLQRFFTGMPYTHSAIVTRDIYEIQSVLSADELINTQPLDNYFNEEKTEIEIFDIIDKRVNTEFKEETIKQLYEEYAGTMYGFAQVLWFVYRWFMEKLGKDVRKKKNPFNKGEICSELVWHYLDRVGDFIPELKAKINEWNPDTIHAGDIHTICISLPKVFKLKLNKKF